MDTLHTQPPHQGRARVSSFEEHRSPRWITVTEAATMLGIGRSTAYDMVRTKELPSVRIRNCIRIPLGALEEMMHREMSGGAGTR